MVTTLPRLEVGRVRSKMDLFHALDLDRNMLRGTLPVVNCNRCGATAHLGRQDARSKSLYADLEQLYRPLWNLHRTYADMDSTEPGPPSLDEGNGMLVARIDVAVSYRLDASLLT